MVLLNIAPDVSRVHASRRVFELLHRHNIDVPVIHHRRCAPWTTSCPYVVLYCVGFCPRPISMQPEMEFISMQGLCLSTI